MKFGVIIHLLRLLLRVLINYKQFKLTIMISPKGLKQFKNSASKLYAVMIGINDLYNTNELTLVRVLVQNASFDGDNCVGYKHEEAVVEVKRIIRLLEQMHDAHNSHFIGYALDYLKDDFTGIEMCEYEEHTNDCESFFNTK